MCTLECWCLQVTKIDKDVESFVVGDTGVISHMMQILENELVFFVRAVPACSWWLYQPKITFLKIFSCACVCLVYVRVLM